MTRHETILTFINNILTNRGTQESEHAEHLFSNGYCYYFAIILKDAFGGEIMWPKYYDHIVWLDTVDNVCYDAHGVNDAHCEQDLVPIHVLTEANLMAFKHTDERIELTPEDMYIQQGLVNEYEFHRGWPLSRYIDGEVQYFNIVKLSNDRTYAYDLRSSTLHMSDPSGFTDFIIDNNLDANKLSWIRRMSGHLEESVPMLWPKATADEAKRKSEEFGREHEQINASPKRSVSDIVKDPVITINAVLLDIPMEEIESRLRKQFGDETTLTNEEIIQALKS